jgi:FdhE protein
MTSPIIRDGSLAGGIPAIAPFRPVAGEVFAQRAARLRALAPGHAIEEYLRFLGALSSAQDQCLRAASARFPAGTEWAALPDRKTLEHCRAHGLPPLSAEGHRRDPAWRALVAQITDSMPAEALPPPARAVIAALAQRAPAALEATADSLLAGAYAEVDVGAAPFIAAALQVYWVRLALELGDAAFSHGVEYGLCPVCGSRPAASVVRVGGAAQGLRYLVCSLCASEWHVVRVKCTACASTKGISTLGIEGADEAVKAECCDACHSYLKLFYLEKNTALEPVADDLATLALDMLVDEQGYHRIGPNLLFLPGAAI